MRRYALRRVLALVPVLFGVTFLSFAMLRLAGSDAIAEMHANAGAAVSREVLDAARVRAGLDRPFLAQYFSWLGGMLGGDLGVSLVSGRDVARTFLAKLPATLLLAAASVSLTVAVSVPLGVLSAALAQAAREKSSPLARRLCALCDGIIRLASFAGNSLPNFFAALLLMHVLALRLGLFPAVADGVSLRGAVMPALTLALAMSAKYLRQVRAVVLDELSKDYVRAARARGVADGVILARSVLRAALPAIVTLLALSVGSLLGGAAIVETIFLWDGVGKWAVDAIMMRDYPVVQAYVVWMAAIYTAVNFAADLAHFALDPRAAREADAK